MGKDTPWKIIIGFFRNEATGEELKQLDFWLDDSENARFFNEIFFAFRSSGSMPGSFQPDKQAAWEKVNIRVKKNNSRFKIVVGKTKYAAAVAVLLVTAFTILWKANMNKLKYISEQQTCVIVPKGQKTTVMLPDSSYVWLNSGSTLKYQADFNTKERKVVLNGEAFFKVHKDKSKRFRVETGILAVDVYGTSFNIKNYGDDNFQEITVEEGKVGVSSQGKEIRQMVAGDKALFDRETHKIEFSKSQPEIVSAWKNNELIFDDTPLEEAVKYLERWYGVNITIDNEMVGKHNYTFKIKTESLREMLEMMKVMTPLDYEINGKDIKISYLNQNQNMPMN